MRLMLTKTFLIAASLTIIAVAATTVLFTRSLKISGAALMSTQAGNVGTLGGPHPTQGLKVLLQLLSEPSFGLPILLPQLVTDFLFLWIASILGAVVCHHGQWPNNSFKPNDLIQA